MPFAVRAQQVHLVHAARVTDAVEEFQDLDGALAAEADRIAIAGRADGAVLPRKDGDGFGQLADALLS